jgi:hypothetical protein
MSKSGSWARLAVRFPIDLIDTKRDERVQACFAPSPKG